MLKTPKAKSQPASFDGVAALLKTPKQQKSVDLEGVVELMFGDSM